MKGEVMKPQDLVDRFRGQYVRGFYTKKDGKRRAFHGQLRKDDRNDNCVLYFDKKKRQFRRMNLSFGEWQIGNKLQATAKLVSGSSS